jgi:hypothetical protein
MPDFDNEALVIDVDTLPLSELMNLALILLSVWLGWHK